MKVLVVGAGKAPAIERYYVDHLRELGVTAEHYAAQNVFFDHYEKNLLNKVAFKAGFSRIYHKINQEFKNIVEEFGPDIIWVFKGMELFPASLQWARDKKIRLANYNTDNPFLFSGSGSGNKNVADSLPLYDLHLTYDRDIRKRFAEQYGIRCELLPFGFEESETLYRKLLELPEKRSLCFVGSPDKERIEFLEAVAAEIPLTIYGPEWRDSIKSDNVTIYDSVYGEDFWKILRQYRVQLNYMRPHNLNSHNMRSFEVPGIGGIMLAPATTDHKEYFEAGQEIFLYSDVRECILKARHILDLPAEDAALIRKRVREKCITSGYSYLGRTRQVLNWFKTL